MPDKLTFTEKIPFEWVSTWSYKKAHKWLSLHTSTHRMVHAVTSSYFIVLTTFGRDLHKKLNNKLIKWYRGARMQYQKWYQLYH